MSAVGYAGRLAHLRGHLVAKVAAAQREMRDRPTHDAEIRYAYAVRELERFDEANRRPAVLHVESWAGRAGHPVLVLGETPQRYRIRHLDSALGWVEGDERGVPKYAITFRDENGPAGGANPTTGPEESGDSAPNLGGGA